MFPILNHPPSSLPIPSLWVVPVHLPQASSIMHRTWTVVRGLWLISYMILYMFQCHSPKLSHPLPLPQSPKDCSVHQCLFCCLVYALISFFLNCWISFLVSFVCWLSLLYFVYWAVLVLLMGVYVCAYISWLYLFAWFCNWHMSGGVPSVSHFCEFASILFNSVSNHLWNLFSWPEIKQWAFGVGALTPIPYTNRERLTLGSIK